MPLSKSRRSKTGWNSRLALLRCSALTPPNGMPISLQEALDPIGKSGIYGGRRTEWIHTSERGVVTNSVGGEVVLDFMFWPSAKHKFGWYLEPGYDYDFGRGHEQSVGVSPAAC